MESNFGIEKIRNIWHIKMVKWDERRANDLHHADIHERKLKSSDRLNQNASTIYSSL